MLGLDAMILVFWMLNVKPAFSFSSFTFIKMLFSSSLISTLGWCHLPIWGYFSQQSWLQLVVHSAQDFTLLCILISKMGLPSRLIGEESACQCRRHGFDPWVGKIPCRRKWHTSPVFLPGKFHGQRSLVGYSPWGHKTSDVTERLHDDNRITKIWVESVKWHDKNQLPWLCQEACHSISDCGEQSPCWLVCQFHDKLFSELLPSLCFQYWPLFGAL